MERHRKEQQRGRAESDRGGIGGRDWGLKNWEREPEGTLYEFGAAGTVTFGLCCGTFDPIRYRAKSIALNTQCINLFMPQFPPGTASSFIC